MVRAKKQQKEDWQSSRVPPNLVVEGPSVLSQIQAVNDYVAGTDQNSSQEDESTNQIVKLPVVADPALASPV